MGQTLFHDVLGDLKQPAQPGLCEPYILSDTDIEKS